MDGHFNKQATGRCVKGVEKILDRFEDLPPIIILVIICRIPSVGFVASVQECYRNVVTIELWGGIKADAMLSSGHFKSFQRCSWGRLWKWKINKFSQYLDRPHISEKESAPCLKCGFRRTHSRINHCSRCDRCVEYMDHHCVFTDNCVSRKNLCYFFHFIGWATQALLVGLVIMSVNIYTHNHDHGYGA